VEPLAELYRVLKLVYQRSTSTPALRLLDDVLFILGDDLGAEAYSSRCAGCAFVACVCLSAPLGLLKLKPLCSISNASFVNFMFALNVLSIGVLGTMCINDTASCLLNSCQRLPRPEHCAPNQP